MYILTDVEIETQRGLLAFPVLQLGNNRSDIQI